MLRFKFFIFVFIAVGIYFSNSHPLSAATKPTSADKSKLVSNSIDVPVPQAIQDILTRDYNSSKSNKKSIPLKFRVDGLMQIGDKLWLPIIPARPKILVDNGGESVVEIVSLNFKSADSNADYLFSNGWIFTPIIEDSQHPKSLKAPASSTIKSFDFYDKKIQEQILKNKIIPDFIVPEGFRLPRDLAIIAGHLPLTFRDVELATEKEEKFAKLLREEAQNKALDLLVYDYMSGDLKLISLDSLSSQEDTQIKTLSGIQQLSLVSNIRKIGTTVYVVDYNKSKIFFLKKTKKSTKEQQFSLEEFISLSPGAGLKDFTISKDGNLIYCLTNKDSKLRIFNAKTKEEITAIKLEDNPAELVDFSRDVNEPDYVLISSKGSNEMVIVNSFDHRISKKMYLDAVPTSFVSDSNSIFVACQNKKDVTKGKIVVLDWITGSVNFSIALEYVPYKTLFSKDFKHLYVLGLQTTGLKDETETILSLINADTYDIEKTIKLSPNVQGSKDMVLSESGKLLIVGSSSSDSIGLVDTDSFELVKTVNIGGRSNILSIL